MDCLSVITFTAMSMAMLKVQKVQRQEVRHATITVGNMGDT
jgi:hypothetical protein